MLSELLFRLLYRFLLLLTIIFGISIADNPLISQRYTADPSGFVYNGRVYVLCSSDEENNNGYNLVYKGSGEPFRLNWFRFTPVSVGIHKKEDKISIFEKNRTTFSAPLMGNRLLSSDPIFNLSGRVIKGPGHNSILTSIPTKGIFIIKPDN